MDGVRQENILKYYNLAAGATSLHRSAWLGDVDKVRDILQQGTYAVNCKDACMRTPLHYACAKGHLDVVKALVSEQADMIVQDRVFGITPLLLASEEVLEYMIEVMTQYVELAEGFKGNDGNTALHYACALGDVKLVLNLIQEHFADVYAANSQGNTPAHIAALHGKLAAMSDLVDMSAFDMRIKGNERRSLLHQACTGGNIDLVRTLIHRHGAKVEAQDKFADTPVHVAAVTGQGEVALILIEEFGCDLSARGFLNRSLLHQACNGGHLKLVRNLVCKHRADIDDQDSNGDMPVHVAAMSGQFEVASALINEFGCDVSVKGFEGRNVLHHACNGGSLDLVHSLITKHQFNVNTQDDYGNTPVNVAALCGRDKVVLLLIKEFNCDIYIRDYKGQSLPHKASIYPHANVISAVSKYVSPLVVDNDGNTPLHTSSNHGHIECVEALLELNAPLFVRNNSSETPRDVATDDVKTILDRYQDGNQEKIHFNYKVMQEHAKKKYSKSQPVTRIFVVGNPGSGKSSFVESMKREGFFQSLRKVSVPLHTAGIVPSIHTGKHYGRVLYYDFSGNPNYYSSHAAFLETFALSESGDNIFMIVVDLREDNATITNTLHFWSSFVGHQKFIKKEPSLVAIGSHLDLMKDKKIAKEKSEVFNNFFKMNPVYQFSYFSFNCCKLGSKEIEAVQKCFISLTKDSPPCELSFEASILLGLLEKDFSNVTACPIATIMSHIEGTEVPLPSDAKSLCSLLEKLHDIGALLVIGDRREGDVQVVMNASRLTNEVHEALFSVKEGEVPHASSGILSESCIESLLPKCITVDSLVKLQYCQEIKLDDVKAFSSTKHDESLYFFPALCTLDKDQVSLAMLPHLGYTIGLFAECTNSCDHFPPRFLHVLLLRLVRKFVLAASPFQCHCTVWTTGVHWLLGDKVECMVEVVKESRGIVVTIKGNPDAVENCINVFSNIVNCVMEAKAEFCRPIRLQFFLLGNVENYLKEGNLFAMSDVEKVLMYPKGVESSVASIKGSTYLERSRLLCMRTFTHWHNLFPMEFASVLHHLRHVAKELFDLGLQLKLPESLLRAGELAHYPRDIDKWRREIVLEWMSSSLDPPCWLHLVEALRNIKFNMSAYEIEEHYGIHVIELQRKLLDKTSLSVTPDVEFLEPFSKVVGPKWPFLASLLSLTSSEVEEIEKAGENQALCVLKKWVYKGGATYGCISQRLKTVSLI